MKASGLNVLLFSLLVYLLLLLLFGYQFGSNDHIELLPYILKIQSPSLYPNDFFLDAMFSMIPNERHVFAYLLSFFPAPTLKWVFFCLHIFSSLLLIFALYRIAEKYISRPYLIWAAIILNLLIFHEWNFGKVEMYYSVFQASNLAKAVAAWAIYFFLDTQRMKAFILLLVATYLQIIVGLNLAIVFSAIIIFSDFKAKPTLAMVKPLFVYLLFTLPFLIWILISRTSTGAEDYFDIMFNFRHQHHFFVNSTDRVVLMLILFFTSLIFYFKRSKDLFLFTIIIALGTAFYIVNMQFLEIAFIANFNWLKNTIWLKYFGFVALMAFVDKYLPSFTFRPLLLTVFLSLAILSTAHLLLNVRHKTNYTAPLAFPSMTQTNSVVDICEQIKNKTPNDALFIQPFNFTALKYHGQRASYIDFKAIARSPRYAGKWYDRINRVYSLSLSDGGGFSMKLKADEHYRLISDEDISSLMEEGITHILTFKNHELAEDIIAENSDYIVYELTAEQ